MLELDDSRRLTGPNLLLDGPGAVLEVRFPARQAETVLSIWQAQVQALLEAVGWADATLAVRAYDGGASLAFSAPIDALYAATELNEAAWNATRAVVEGGELADLRTEVNRLRRVISEEQNPPLRDMQRAADRHGVRFVSDDDEASVGSGRGSITWLVSALPAPEAVDWSGVYDVPVALVTGTNGKSTTVRLTAALLQGAGRTVGLTSTDFIRVGTEIVDRGDYSGPSGGRTVLRHRSVDVALLEVARGGILRRGLAVPRAEAAVITNVAADHLGEYGIHTVDELADVKFVVRKALADGAPLILNADDPVSVRRAAAVDTPLCWFSLDAGNAVVRAHRGAGGTACFVRDGSIVYADSRGETSVIAVADVPMTLGGAARHNVANALAAVALARALHAPAEAVAEGLRRFRSDPRDNPGRGNFFTVNGARALLDFAHNEHGVAAIVDMLRKLPATRRLVLLGQAGDRPDDDIRALTRAVAKLQPDRVIVSEFLDYMRGRELGEVPRIIGDELRRLGVPDEAVSYAGDCPEGVEAALAWARAGDQLLLLAHSQRARVLELLQAAAS